MTPENWGFRQAVAEKHHKLASTLRALERGLVAGRLTIHRRAPIFRLAIREGKWPESVPGERITMRVGVFTPLLSELPLAAVLKKLAALQINTVELGTGNYPGDAHCKLAMLENTAALSEFQKTLADHGASISALSCHGNPLHPDENRAKHDREVSRKTILLAEKLGVPVVVDFSGCPGDSPNAIAPNWVTCPWPPEYLKVLDWQWNEVVAPYWTQHAKFAADHGVKIAIEMHPGFVAYSPETLLKLRGIAGPSIGCNFDPSHLFWQNIDPIAAVRLLGDAIFHVHAKDTQMYPANLPRTGVLDTQPYTRERTRGWIFRTCGYGHGAEWWSAFISTLRMYGYDSALSIEHEDSLLSPEEGLTKAANFLNGIVIREKSGAAWWV
jgi:sugar phosphate isomerase/epimerase